jgi:Zn-dependent protease
MREYRGPAELDDHTVDVGVEQREAAQRGTAEEGKKRKGLLGLGGTLAAIGAWLLKLKGLAFLLKFGWAGISAVFSIAVYSLFFGWTFALGLVALLFIHEMGHAIVMKLKGIPVGGMIFIPMLGAAVLMRQMPQNARDEAEVGIAGPIAGAIASSFCLFMARMPGAHPVWAPLAYFGFFMNLFNLIPIVPFDGGRVLAAIDRRVWIVGFLGLLAYQIWSWINGNFSPWLLFFVFMAATQLWSRGAAPQTAASQSYYNVPVVTRITLGLLYFGLAAVLFLGMSMAHTMMPVVH